MIAMTTPTRQTYAMWFDSKPEDVQALIEEISDRTFHITESSQFDEFIEELESYGIITASNFEDAFMGEFAGNGNQVVSEFSSDLMESCGFNCEPDFVRNCIDWELVWYSALRYDYNAIVFKGNTYFFSNNF